MRKLGLDLLARFIRDSPFRRRYLRYNFVLALTIAIFAGFSLWLSYNLRFEFQIPEEHSFNLLIVIADNCKLIPTVPLHLLVDCCGRPPIYSNHLLLQGIE